MSPENVDIVRGLPEVFNRRDIPAMLALLDPDVEWIPIMATLEGRVYRGHDGVCQWIEDLGTDWEYFETYTEEWHDLGDRVLAFGRWRARGRASGIELENEPASWLWDVRDGKIVRLQTFTDRTEAIEAAGLMRHDAPDVPR